MKIKTYGLFENDRQIILIFSNPSQKQFLDFQLKNSYKKFKKIPKIQFDNSANGVWYCRQHPSLTQLTQILLIQKQAASISLASDFFNKVADIQKKFNFAQDQDRIRFKIDDLIKLYNANTKVDNLSTNVIELQDIMKGNINKIVGNMTELDTAQRKSSIMNDMSMQFERDSKALEQKMKKRKCLMKTMVAGLISLLLGIILWIFIL